MAQKKNKKALDEESVGMLFENISKEIYTYVTNPH
jgi:septum formation inhibitor-activating ATPase MinD